MTGALGLRPGGRESQWSNWLPEVMMTSVVDVEFYGDHPTEEYSDEKDVLSGRSV